MATSIAFDVEAKGYKGFSYGKLIIALNRGGVLQVYKWSGSGLAKVAIDCHSNAGTYIEPAASLPDELQQYTFRFKLEGGATINASTEMKFSIFSETASDAVFDVTRHPEVKGFNLGGVDALGKLTPFRNTPTIDGAVPDLDETLRITILAEQLGFKVYKKNWYSPPSLPHLG